MHNEPPDVDRTPGRVPVGLLMMSIAAVGGLLCTSCALVELTGDTVVLTGKVASTAVKTTGTVVTTGVKVAETTVGTTAKLGGATITRFRGERVIELEREGNSFYVEARINGKQSARLMLDTGASSVQITPRLARRAGIDIAGGESVKCTLANGASVPARAVTLDEVRLNGVKARDVRALILDQDASSDSDGLLGMSFLDNFIFKVDPNNNQLILKYKPK